MKEFVGLLGWIFIVFFGLGIICLNWGIGLGDIPWSLGLGFGLIKAITLWILMSPRPRVS